MIHPNIHSSIQMINKLLNDSFTGFKRLTTPTYGESGRCLAIITKNEHNGTVNMPTKATIPPVHEFSSPFIGWSAEEIGRKIVHQSYYCFAVLDERSGQDETVIIGVRIGDEIHTVRADFMSGQLLMQNLAIINIDIWEVKRHADANEGVCRFKEPPPPPAIKKRDYIDGVCRIKEPPPVQSTADIMMASADSKNHQHGKVNEPTPLQCMADLMMESANSKNHGHHNMMASADSKNHHHHQGKAGRI